MLFRSFGVPIYGLEGGAEGPEPAAESNRRGSQPGTQIELRPGDALVLTVPGGGGFGDPRQRAREAVLEDVRNGLVSRAAARELYGTEVP